MTGAEQSRSRLDHILTNNLAAFHASEAATQAYRQQLDWLPQVTSPVLKSAGVVAALEQVQRVVASWTAFASEPFQAGVEAAITGFTGPEDRLRATFGVLQQEQIASAHRAIQAQYDAAFASSPAYRDTLEAVTRYATVQTTVAGLSWLTSDTAVLGGPSWRSGQPFDRLLESSATRTPPGHEAFIRTGADTQGQLELADAVAAPALDTSAVDDCLGSLANTPIKPWITGPAEASDALHSALQRRDRRHAGLLEEAWGAVQRGGDAATDVVAGCLIELLDRTLDGLAPADDVRRWIEDPSRAHLRHDRNPDAVTRKAQVYFAMQERAAEERATTHGFIAALAAAATTSRSKLQQPKHGERAITLPAARFYLLALEGVLTVLLLDS